MLRLKYFMSEKSTTMCYTEATNFLKAVISISPQNKNAGDKKLLFSTFPGISPQRYFYLTISTSQSVSIHCLQDTLTLQILKEFSVYLVNSSLRQSNLFSFSDFFSAFF